jgi:dihydrofolate reductase
MARTIDQEGKEQFISNFIDVLNCKTVNPTRRPISLIAAVDLDGGYAKAGKIPWYYSEDFKWFKFRTANAICVMGRTTYEDINERLGEKAKESVLPGRTCFVVSSTLESVDNATVVKSLLDIEQHLELGDLRELCVIGGGRLFGEAVGIANLAYITVINKEHQCDAFFPVKQLMKNFKVSQTFKGKEVDLRYTIWHRK